MEELNGIVTLISTVGFPIAACVGLFYLYDRTIKGLTVTLSKIDTTLDGVAKAIEDMRKGELRGDRNA